LPQPLGPTTEVSLLGSGRLLGSTKDLNPASLIPDKRMYGLDGPVSGRLVPP
jgi:hypothetical protein